MNAKGISVLWLLILSLAVSCKKEADIKAEQSKVNQVLDDWHNASAEADFDRYFSHFASDSSIFMGTDATERWTVPEFKKYARGSFAKGRGWDLNPVERHVYISESGRTAWFDEVLNRKKYGPARGTGVLVKQDTTWKIAHYNLSMPIPNAIGDTVIKLIKKELVDSTQNN